MAPWQLLITHYFRPVGSPPLLSPDFVAVENLLNALPELDIATMRSNFAPSEPQRQRFRLKLDSLLTESLCIEREMGRLQLSILRLKHHLSQLESDLSRWIKLHAKLQDAVAGYRCISSPIRRIPTEILGEIFAQCVAADKKGKDPSFSLLRIIRVCRRWRDAALSSPTLWGLISLDSCRMLDGEEMETRSVESWIDDDDIVNTIDLDGPSILKRAALYLQHSGTAVPLSVHWSHNFVRVGPPSRDGEDLLNDARYSEFLDKLLAESPRWEAVELALEEEKFAAFVSKAGQVSFPMLREVVIRATCRGVPWNSPRCAAFLESLPALSRLVVNGRANTIWLDRNSAPWARLRSIKIESGRGRDVLAVLPLFAANASLHLQNITLPQAPLIPAALIKTCIGALYLGCCEDSFTSTLLRTIVAPYLTELHIRGTSWLWLDGTHVPLIAPFIERSSCRLVKLSLDVHHSRCNAYWPRILELLQSKSASSLVEFELSAPPMVPRLIDALITQQDLLVDLRALRLRYRHREPHKIDDGSVIALHANRPKLQELWLCSSISGLSRATMRLVNATGLRIVVSRWSDEY
ncbi:hypothetical protein C8F01DRAFT_1365370 [Mycena amicta]|nr:hypothetical protein C8F01DRAFT_1365370 [Mycena amicta]